MPTLRTLTILLAFAALTVTGVGCQVFREHDAAALRAGHWPQEPDGFGGLKFDATRAETEKKIKLENCQILEVPAAVKKAVGGKMNLPLECKASLKLAKEVLHRQCPVRHSARWYEPINQHLRHICPG